MASTIRPTVSRLGRRRFVFALAASTAATNYFRLWRNGVRDGSLGIRLFDQPTRVQQLDVCQRLGHGQAPLEAFQIVPGAPPPPAHARGDLITGERLSRFVAQQL